MIRFIDIRGQGTGRRFAFFDTIANHFLTTESGHAWNEKEDIEREPTFSCEMKDRLISLLPGWAHHDEDGESLSIPEKKHKPDTVSWTWEGILGQLDRYGGSPDARLFEILDNLTDVNDDMAHDRINPDPLTRIQANLDKLGHDLFSECDILSPFDNRVLAFLFLVQYMDVGSVPDFQKTTLIALGSNDDSMNKSVGKLIKMGFIGPDGKTPQH